MKYEVRQIDAWIEPDGGWTWNDSFYMFSFKTEATDVKRAFIRSLKRNGISFIRGHMRVDTYDGDSYEIVRRKNGEPLFAAMLQVS